MQNGAPNWDSVSIGIITFATIMAAATSAGIFAVAAREESYPEGISVLAALLVTISLLAYLFVLFSSLRALFLETQAARRAQVIKTSYAVFAQAYTAVIAASLLIYSPLLERVPW